LFTGCDKKQVPPGYSAKLLTEQGYTPEVYHTGWVTVCSVFDLNCKKELIFLETSEGQFTEKVTIRMKDNMNLVADYVRIRVKINTDKKNINSVFNFNEVDWEFDISNYLKHSFSLLGIEDQVVSYDSKYKGFEQKKYDFYIKWDKNGDFLSKIVNKGNLSESIKIWGILFDLNPAYIPIDWQRDFKSGFRWNSKKYHLLVEYGKEEGVDVKLPWELSRFQHLVQMGIVYKSNKNKDIIKELGQLDRVNKFIYSDDSVSFYYTLTMQEEIDMKKQYFDFIQEILNIIKTAKI